MMPEILCILSFASEIQQKFLKLFAADIDTRQALVAFPQLNVTHLTAPINTLY
jgi:hypothetical protein